MSFFNIAAGAAIGVAAASLFPISRMVGAIGGIAVSVLLSKNNSDDLSEGVSSLVKTAAKISLALIASTVICSAFKLHSPLPCQITHTITKIMGATKDSLPFAAITVLAFLIL